MYIVFSYFPFDFVSRIMDLIVSVSGHCLRFYYVEANSAKFQVNPHTTSEDFIF